MNRYRNFSEKIIKKYSFFRKSGRLPALIFLRLFGLRDTDRENSDGKNTGPEWRINNYFEFHFYTGVIRKPPKFFRVSGGSAFSYPSVKYLSVKREDLLPASYTITWSDKQTVKPTVKLTVLPARRVTGSYLQEVFNRVNTVPGYMSMKYEMAGKNALFPALIPITNPAELTLNSTDFSINNYLHRTSAKDAFPKNNKITYTLLSGIHNSKADAGLTPQGRFVKTILKRDILTGLILNVQKMNERLSGRKQGTTPGNIVPAAKPALHFASESGKTEKPARIEDTIDTIVRKHTDLVLRRTSGNNIANNIKKQDVMKTTDEEVRERNINKSILQERKPGDINIIADTVYKLIERRLLIEKEKRGLA